ncbi:UDP-glucose dehydrogenase family protein [Paenibacillus dendritiformis]|uniref:UDP-glucose dehydrogenase family protein n=1 Tax=Paenibacillus dendritiformis TaxID=130049 RepID=UPI000DA9F272|nr:UDP-glucose/GDP-mannose dehydrogenase family protein [Paenibacillus dendritiformis]PZM67230.1 UDP-glucose 6-dehydrogenase [Paenibacillus dendritiformis]
MKCCVIGVGYVGLVSGACMAEMGNSVICVDSDKLKIDQLNSGVMPIYEKELGCICERNKVRGRLIYTTNLSFAIQNSDIIFIAVGTPSLSDGQVDLSQLENVAKGIAKHINGYKIIVNKSTVPVGTQKYVTRVIKENLKEHIEFDVVSMPEFLREGSAVHDTLNAERIVIGAESEKATKILKKLHEPYNAPILVTEPESAELMKYAANSFLATKITFINEIANICEKVGADVVDIARGIGLDSRISSKFLQAGIGFGGACFPKDTRAVVKIAEDYGYEFEILKSVIAVNEKQKLKPYEKLKKIMGSLEGKNIAILGLAFKPNTDDMREAPSIDIIKAIQKDGGKIKAYDPVAMNNSRMFLSNVEYSESPYEAVINVDAIILVTEWNEFKELDLNRIKENSKGDIFIDGRNVFQYEQMKKHGFQYYCIGRRDDISKGVALQGELFSYVE